MGADMTANTSSARVPGTFLKIALDAMMLRKDARPMIKEAKRFVKSMNGGHVRIYDSGLGFGDILKRHELPLLWRKEYGLRGRSRGLYKIEWEHVAPSD